MTLKAILFDFNGVIINDEAIHKELIANILLQENLRPSTEEYNELCLGRSDRACLRDVLERRGRVISDAYLDKLIANKAQAYQRQLEALPELPLYPGLQEFLDLLHNTDLILGLVTGASRSDVEVVLQQAQLEDYFSVLVTGDDVGKSKPEPDGYLWAVEKLREQFPQLQLQTANCLAIEDTATGIQAAKRAGMQVVGIAHTYPAHMLQRQANWTVDYFVELELERIQRVFAGEKLSTATSD